MSIGWLILLYIIRAIGDVASEPLSLMSPLGLILRTEVYVNNQWWPVLVGVLLFVITVFVAFYLHQRRDMGAGLLPSKQGRRTASRFLCSPLGLTLRMMRTMIIAWSVGMFLLGISYGSIFGDLESFIKNNDMIQQIIASHPDYSVTEQFITQLMVILAIIATIPAVTSFLNIRSEEKKERLEHLYTKNVSRIRLFFVYVGIGCVVGPLALLLSVIGLWLSSMMVMADPLSFSIFMKAGMVYVPAIWVVLVIASLLFAFVPKWTSIVWVYVVFSFITVYLGDLIDIPEWLVNVSSYSHIPQLPVENVTWLSLVVLIIVWAIGTWISMAKYRYRDHVG
ncbi:ABC transporter permease [Gracilibacillus halophilus]|uniref:ABC transporter permease n=1 Tax=Gracilibacillus halophilus TaxID=470864 RepID=UPI00039E097B|nr:hypothetical protein [Gracilibacillus halophilus]